MTLGRQPQGVSYDREHCCVESSSDTPQLPSYVPYAGQVTRVECMPSPSSVNGSHDGIVADLRRQILEDVKATVISTIDIALDIAMKHALDSRVRTRTSDHDAATAA